MTDANLVLGFYDPGFFLGGRMRLDLEAARTAIGAAAALGFLVAPLSFEDVRSMRVELSAGFDAAAVNAMLQSLEDDGLRHLDRAVVARAEAVARI